MGQIRGILVATAQSATPTATWRACLPACLPPPSSAVTFGFLCGSDFLHSRPLFFFFVYSSSSDDDLHLR